MIVREFTVLNKVGLHARPAAVFVATARKFKSDIVVEKGRKRASARSILGLLTLGAGHGAVVAITIEGEDEQEAMKALAELVANKFGDEE
ncbi:HPr family phosphocarrier protein [Candidatus Cryosericum terrychapinii]|uniref:HPr family phosphocarrier protein n=1 Tax=Candidatus Cryosericum terrychapinii TaxID=2290919 RepID=A0A398CVW2_9BACT|nr:HPr family phosphocarrier protein [Candidatus Cryosericum terrychapinii]RIE06785.1 HPr family phosphocarrier protein [Candidatus Cryosericum terrychapinii]